MYAKFRCAIRHVFQEEIKFSTTFETADWVKIDAGAMHRKRGSAAEKYVARRMRTIFKKTRKLIRCGFVSHNGPPAKLYVSFSC